MKVLLFPDDSQALPGVRQGPLQGTDLLCRLDAVLRIQCLFRMELKARRLCCMSCSATTHGNWSVAANSCTDLQGDGLAWPRRLQGNRGHVAKCAWTYAPLFSLMPPCPLLQLSGALTSPGTDASVTQACSHTGLSRWHGVRCTRVRSHHLSHLTLGWHRDTAA